MAIETTMPNYPAYRTFILRMWLEDSTTSAAPSPPWRYSLELISAQPQVEPAITRRYGFADFESLMAWLRQWGEDEALAGVS